MSSFPAGPQLFKGAVVTVDPNTQQPSVIMFQYNPERLRRSLQPQTVGGDTGNRSQAVIYTGAPVESITADIEIDATDQLAADDQTTVELGIYPQLAALELLLYPKSADVNSQAQLLSSGTIEVGPFVAPLTLFIWGQNRVVPVRVTEMSISEEAFGGYLNPIRATVSLSMRVLSFSDYATTTQGYNLFMQYQQVKEQIAVVSHSLQGTGVNPSQM
jgi:Contractile injection system tube protein